jgi:signal peptidase I
MFSGKSKKNEAAEKPKKSQLRDWTEALIVAGVLALIIRTFVVQAFKIPSGSMEDTLLIGDHLLVNKFIYGTQLPFTDDPSFVIRDPQRGDVIVFEFPQDKDKSYFKRRDFIKRVIGLPGDEVVVRGKEVFVNGKRYLTPQAVFKGPNVNINLKTVVPEDQYFVLGDNRNNSQDSRFWGFVDREKIKGLAFIKYWSWDSENFSPRFGRIGGMID